MWHDREDFTRAHVELVSRARPQSSGNARFPATAPVPWSSLVTISLPRQGESSSAGRPRSRDG
jgi:hypothetical protein